MDFDPYSHALHADPYPVYAELREKYPVHYNPTHDFWHVDGYDDVLEAIHQPQVFSATARPAARPGDPRFHPAACQ